MKEQLGHPEQEVIDAYLRASDALPTRAEALHAASRFCRQKGRGDQGYQFAKRGLNISMPTDALFVEPGAMKPASWTNFPSTPIGLDATATASMPA